MKVSGVRGAIWAGMVGLGLSGCSSEADGGDAETFGEVTQALCSTTKALQRTAATALPVAGLQPTAAIDGNTSTFWRSVGDSRASLTVDMGKMHVVSKVQLDWQASCGKDYDIQTSTDNKSWVTVASVRGNSGAGVRSSSGFSKKARFVRMQGIAPCSQQYELAELSVFGDVATNCLKADGAQCSTVDECAGDRCVIWYGTDADGDGFGAVASATKLCGQAVAPAGYVSTKSDCCDSDARANPGQNTYFASANACGSFDYDCNGSEQMEHGLAAQTTCNLAAQTCTVDRAGFGVVPTCGAPGSWVESCTYMSFSSHPRCLAVGEPGLTQLCR